MFKVVYGYSINYDRPVEEELVRVSEFPVCNLIPVSDADMLSQFGVGSYIVYTVLIGRSSSQSHGDQDSACIRAVQT